MICYCYYLIDNACKAVGVYISLTFLRFVNACSYVLMRKYTMKLV